MGRFRIRRAYAASNGCMLHYTRTSAPRLLTRCSGVEALPAVNRFFVLAVVLTPLSLACGEPSPGAEGESASASSETAGGSGTEESADGAESTGDEAGDGDGDGDGDSAVLNIGFSIHLEGWMVSDPAVYDLFTGRVRELAADSAGAGARLTFEAGDDLTRAVLAEDDSLYSDLEDLGHDVEVHADLGFAPNLASLSQQDFEADMIAYRQRALDAGASANHVSGVCSHLDWLQATRVAGYTGLGGTVSYCWMAAPEMVRPPQYANCPTPAACHDPWPESFEHRMHPWRVQDIAAWDVHDPKGDLVIVPTATGLTCLEETSGGQGAGGGCVLTQADVDLWTLDLDQAITLASPDQVNAIKGTFSMGPPVDPTLMEGVWSAAAVYVADGRARWATVADIQSEFEAWE